MTRTRQVVGVPRVRGIRAGRDLPAAIVVGVALALIIIVPLFTVRPLWIAVICVTMAVGTYELVRALRLVGGRIALPPLAAGTAAMPAVAYATGTSGLVVTLAATVVMVTAWRLAYRDGHLLHDVAAGVFCAAYVGLPAGFAALLTSPPDGPRRMVACLATAVASDIGGYTAGVLSGGRHKLAPNVSPGKSWEGFAGSAVTCVIVAGVSMAWTLHAAVWQGVVLGLAVACTATIGDLGESLLKRDIGIKDMGTLLPGHGGIMDRLDSVLCTAPVAWLLITAFVPPS
ncbi:phosphatidate cytidylyltransferase [Protofrankia symbiont of Coriaria ruscifolia]|uniref:phosphatidate cytidylyltransferase n=1 Tax=Protofrankia symbiont of Coriaria ruscifolia TaxID=1306542 RepID=UPI0010411923|nr:phosphatidate cytidylyltransferase [Protofrankia symbiont of Coriaria ruscifolia]